LAALAATGGAHGARAIVQMLAGVPPEVREGGLVGVEELGEPLVGAGAVEAAAAEAERQHEDMELDGTRAEVQTRLPPIDLTLRARRRLEAPLRQVRDRLLGAERPDEELHRLVAASVAMVATELLEQNPRRVSHPRRTLAKKRGVLGEQRVRPL